MIRHICWFSAGAASAVATKLTLATAPDAIPVYCDTGAEHEDNSRFIDDCAAWFGKPVTNIRSGEYTDTWDVWERTRWLAGIQGARCTVELKVVPRLELQQPGDVHVFGYTADSADVRRAAALRASWIEMTVATPLIDRGVTKAACLDMVHRAGIRLPATYALGFPNANCLPCPKATSPAYWALVRRHFPGRFDRMARLSRNLGVRLARVGGERVFIDEIPLDHPITSPIVPSCDFLCALAEQEMMQ